MLIVALLKIDYKHWDRQVKVKKIENKNIISCLLNAPLGHKNNQEKRIKSKVTFFNAQTHPLFENQILTMGETIIDNYESILNYK